jgi:hypothetical protein
MMEYWARREALALYWVLISGPLSLLLGEHIELLGELQ